MRAEVIVLGRAQDAGVPQAGCACERCTAVRRGASGTREFAASLAVLDETLRQAWIIDAGPDFREQLALLNDLRPGFELKGIFISHLHIGHYVGLVHLGKEAMNAAAMPVCATPRICAFLRTNGPWSQLVAEKNIALHEVPAPGEVRLSDRVQVETIPVPHRDEFGDTCAFIIRGPQRSLFYCPDIDSWNQWDRDIRSVVSQHDFALLDGTFFSASELPGRDISKIPHPTIEHTMELIGNGEGRVFFTHLNHSNPLLSSPKQREAISGRGYAVVEHGESFSL